ncbi:hypothetical protein GX48_07474, partial [Paracoccidioides brasiliensis]
MTSLSPLRSTAREDIIQYTSTMYSTGGYEVIGKLAFGQFSTVWLAHNQLLQRHVALKILKADVSRNNKGLAIVSGRPHQAAYVRAISKQVLLGVDFLHELGITHCHLQTANVLFSIVGAAHAEAEVFLQPPEFSPVRWLEGMKVNDSAPKYLMTSQRRAGANWPTQTSPQSWLRLVIWWGGG